MAVASASVAPLHRDAQVAGVTVAGMSGGQGFLSWQSSHRTVVPRRSNQGFEPREIHRALSSHQAAGRHRGCRSRHRANRGYRHRFRRHLPAERCAGGRSLRHQREAAAGEHHAAARRSRRCHLQPVQAGRPGQHGRLGHDSGHPSRTGHGHRHGIRHRARPGRLPLRQLQRGQPVGHLAHPPGGRHSGSGRRHARCEGPQRPGARQRRGRLVRDRFHRRHGVEGVAQDRHGIPVGPGHGP